ncbi:hypothetical protein BFG51_06765 [Dietzia alimentaria]|nr:hypothetical protein BFG51_06765 [Dietzia alimentaria]
MFDVAASRAAATFDSNPARDRATWPSSAATRPCMGARQLWHTASARASAASAGLGGFCRPRIRVIIRVICFLSARPLPVMAALTSEGVWKATGMSR